MAVVVSLLHSLRFFVRSRAALHLEIVALRHQLAVANRSRHSRFRLTTIDWVLWAWLSQRWSGWRAALHVVQEQAKAAAMPGEPSPDARIELDEAIDPLTFDAFAKAGTPSSWRRWIKAVARSRPSRSSQVLILRGH